MYTCQICLDSCDKTINCPFCDCGMCVECSKDYFNSCIDENKIPKCININTKCTFMYTTSIFKKYKLKEIVESFNKVIIDNEKNFDDKILTELEIDNKVKKMKKEVLDRKKLFEEKIPEGMREITAMLSKNIFKKKIKQNEKTMREGDTPQKFIECPKITCNGHINMATNQCMICGINICNICREIKDSNHKCKKEVLETLKEIEKNSQKCPKCKISINRRDGCSQMWCTNCKTFFDYDTGKIIENGHNPEANVFHHQNKRTQIKEHNRPELSEVAIKNTKGEIIKLFNDIYDVLPKLKTNKTESLKLDLKRDKIEKEEYDKKVQKAFESDYISKEYVKILMNLAENIYKHANDKNHKIDDILSNYFKQKGLCQAIYKIGIELP